MWWGHIPPDRGKPFSKFMLSNSFDCCWYRRRGQVFMKPLTWLELQSIRKEIAGMDISEERMDELILLMDVIVVSWIDQAFGFSAVHLSLSARANYAFAGVDQHGNLSKHDENQPLESEKDSEINALGANRYIEP